MNTSYWYFEFSLYDKKTEYYKKDYSVVTSCDRFFPVSRIMDWKDEELGEDAELNFIFVIEISEETYNDIANRIEREMNEHFV